MTSERVGAPAGQRQRRSTVWATRALLAAVVVGVVLSLTRVGTRDGDGWALAAACAVAAVLVALLVWLTTGIWSRRAARLQRQHPGAWVRPMSRGQSLGLLFIDESTLQLLGPFGGVRQSYSRSALTSVDVGPVHFPAATRTGLRLRFDDGVEWDLLTMRRGGLTSSVPDARAACEYLEAGVPKSAITDAG